MTIAPQAGAAQAGADRTGLARWSACLLLVAGLHAGLVLRLRDLAPAAFAPPEAVLIDLAPEAPAAPAEAAATEPEQEERPPVMPQAEAPAIPEPVPAESTPEPVPPEPAPPDPEPPVPAPPELPVPAPDAILPLPPPPATPPPPARRAPPRPAPPRPAPDARRSAPVETEAPAPAVPAPSTAPAMPAASSPSQAPAWQSALLGRLQRAKRYPDLARARRQEGVAHLTFSMDREGRVLSARIVRSSGSEELDAETLALVRRAEPLPAPPADLPGNLLTLTVPVRFSLR